MKRERFFLSVCRLAVPAALQSMLQSSFGVVDQLMIGQMGSVEVAGIGLAAKFASMFSVLVSAVATVAGIMISQYVGRRSAREVQSSFRVNLMLAMGIAAPFTMLCAGLPYGIMGLYTRDAAALAVAAEYLRIYAAAFLPAAGTAMLSTLFRCMDRASLPLWAGAVSMLSNTVLNYVLIFGHFGFAPMRIAGAAVASVVSQCAGFLMLLPLYLRNRKRFFGGGEEGSERPVFRWVQYGAMLLPVMICEFMWSLGENVYAGIYGRMGTAACAAMTLLNPVQGLTIGALSGLAQAAGIIVGKRLGAGDPSGAYEAAKKLIRYGFVSSLALSMAVVLLRSGYVALYRIEESVRELARRIMLAYAAVAPVKVLNMIVGGGVLRSGGRTEYVMAIDLVGTWLFGVPLGLLMAFVFRRTIPWVYFMLSLEECVRFAISMVVLRRKKWMRRLSSEA